MADEEKTEETESAPSGGGGGGGKVVVVVSVFNLLATLAIVGLLFTQHKKESAHPRVGDIQEEDPLAAAEGEEGKEGEKAKDGEATDAESQHDFGKMVTLEQFTVNLSTSGGNPPKFARVNISLEVKTADTESELAQKMPRVRNTIIDLFNSKRPGDLATPEGRSYLKDEVQNALNSFLITGKINGVFFTNFALSG